MTPQEEIAELKRLLNGYRQATEDLEAGLEHVRLEARRVRDGMPPPYDTRLEEFAAICTAYLKGDLPAPCETCGDSDCEGGLPCETGDGV